MTEKRIVITGIGPLASPGLGKDAFWKGIVNNRTNVTKEECKVGKKTWESYFIHKIKNFKISKQYQQEFNAIKIEKNDNPLDLYYLIMAAKLALEDGALKYDAEDNDVGLILTHENLGYNSFAEKAFSFSYKALKGRPNRKLDKINFFKKAYINCYKSVYDLQTFMHLFYVGKMLKLHGTAFFINNACASGVYALEAGAMLIRSGHCRSVVIAAADKPDVYKYLWFKNSHIYSESGIIKPFAENADGFVLGDGGAGILVEDYDQARRRKAHIYAEYLGGSFKSEGWKVSLPAVGRNFYEQVITKCLSNSSVNLKDIDLVVPHGVGNRIVDEYEAAALFKIFKPDKNSPIFTAFKPFIGHNLGGSTLLETIIALLGVDNNLIPPLLNCKTKNKNIKINFLQEFVKKRIKYFLKTVTAFAGFDAALLFKKI